MDEEEEEEKEKEEEEKEEEEEEHIDRFSPEMGQALQIHLDLKAGTSASNISTTIHAMTKPFASICSA